MPAPLARGIIITVTVLVAASIAAYENPQVRAWIDRTRHKIAMGLHSLGDEVGPKPWPQPRRTSTDISMHEDKGEMAEERRRQAIAEIMERGRVMEERRKRRKVSDQQEEGPPSPTFDELVDQNGVLLQNGESQSSQPAGQSSAVETFTESTKLRQRPGASDQHESPSIFEQPPDASVSRDINPSQENPFESRYEQEMREAWNLPLSSRRIEIPPSHASESLIELTPTTESAPDPDFSIPSADYLARPMSQTDYFSAAASNSTHTLSDHESQASVPVQTNYLNLPRSNPAASATNQQLPASMTPSISGSISDIHASEAEESADDLLSEIGDGIRTPGSTWTDVDSTVSGDFHL